MTNTKRESYKNAICKLIDGTQDDKKLKRIYDFVCYICIKARASGTGEQNVKAC